MKVILQKKRQVFLALFLFLSSATVAAQPQCMAHGQLEHVRVKRVIDGNTVLLVDGRYVRMVGIIAPELDYLHGQHQPYALKAKQALFALVGDDIYLQSAKDSLDEDGHHLYYLFDKDRISIASQLLSQGLGYRIAMPPNLAYQSCLKHAEQVARVARLGLWQQPLTWQQHSQFTVSPVVIVRVTHNKGGWWLETTHHLIIHLPLSVPDYWPAQKIYFLQGHLVEARGWQYPQPNRHKAGTSWVMTIKHPNDLLDLGLAQ